MMYQKYQNDAILDHSRTVYEQNATEGLPLLDMPALVLENQDHHACTMNEPSRGHECPATILVQLDTSLTGLIYSTTNMNKNKSFQYQHGAKRLN